MLTLALTALAAAGWEAALRSDGFRPTVGDSPAIWALQRGLAEGSRPLVLVGASRMQLDVDPVVLSETLKRPVVQLAIDGSNPMPVLADLAEDESFRGSVWVSLRAEHLLGLAGGRSREYVAHWHEIRGNPVTRWNTAAVAAVDSRLALRNVRTSLRKLMRPALPHPSYISMRRDRYMPADYAMPGLNFEYLRAARIRGQMKAYGYWANHRPTNRMLRMFDDSVAVLEERVRAIRRRGGEVALIRLPMGPALWATTESVFPRRIFWDRMAARTSARVVHFRDEPSLDSFPLPDDSHLDFRDAPAFTRALAAAVSRR